MKLYPMRQKKVIRFKKKAEEFLKAYTTNTLDRPRNAFVDVHGRIVAVCEQFKISEEEVLVVLGKAFVERLKRHLEKYLDLGETRMEETDLNVYFDLEGDYEALGGEFVISVPPRPALLVLTRRLLPSDVSEDDLTLFRVQNNFPLQGVDYDEEMLLAVGDEEFVSYTKGCYLGQEIIARVHHRSAPSRKLVAKREEECAAEELSRMTSRCMDPRTGKAVGFVLTRARRGGS